MTNADTHELVAHYFHQNSYFGIMKENIVFVEAHRMPILSNDGNIILKNRDEVAMASAGNGAFFDTLNANEQLRSFMEEELDYVQIIGVKNLLTKVLDPAQIGQAFKHNAQVVVKAVQKISPNEKIGAIVIKDSRPYIESNLDQARRNEKSKNGSLAYSLGSVFEFIYSVPKLVEISKDAENLKKMYRKEELRQEVWSEEQQKAVMSEKNNAIQFQLTVHESLQFVDREAFFVLQVERDEEFAPIKQLEGEEATPEAARRALSDLHIKYLALAGAEFEGEGNFEIDTLLTYQGEGLEQFEGRTFTLPFFLKNEQVRGLSDSHS
jgi:UDP-N-acetylglucosamine/UDP-N-acetylgalactosamine diphosphorylase